MTYNPNIHRRRSIRLKDYDYSQAGLYFITVCVQNRECLLGEIIDGKMILNEYGKQVETVWNELPQHYSNVYLDAFIIMPNHIHGIIALMDTVEAADVVSDGESADIVPDGESDSVGAGFKPAPTFAQPAPPFAQPTPTSGTPSPPSAQPAPTIYPKQHGLPEIVRALKTFSARRVNEMRGISGISLWQRNYYETIIRNSQSYQIIADYILNNPDKWLEDKLYHV